MQCEPALTSGIILQFERHHAERDGHEKVRTGVICGSRLGSALASAITHLSKDDPPLYMVYSEADGPLPADAAPGQGIHHPNFGRQLKKKMDQLGIENVFLNQPGPQGRNPLAEMMQFFQKQFAKVGG